MQVAAPLHQLLRDGACGQAFLDEREKLLDAHFFDHVFETCLVAVSAVSMIDEYAHDGVGHHRRIGRPDNDASIAGKTVVTGKAAEAKTEPNAGIEWESFVYLDRLETDVICVLQHRDEPRAVKTNIELARQAVERTVVEDVKMPFACVGTGVDQFLRGRYRRSAFR